MHAYEISERKAAGREKAGQRRPCKDSKSTQLNRQSEGVILTQKLSKI